jgi:hypothetical protein
MLFFQPSKPLAYLTSPRFRGHFSLAMEILLLEENEYMDLRQGMGHLINAIVAVLGPELALAAHSFRAASLS